MNAYPLDFQSWPLEKKNAFFAAEAAAYRETNGNGAADHAKPARKETLVRMAPLRKEID
jgi:hypothetical protein